MVITPKYMLDTNICIYLMKHTPPSVVQRFSQCFVGEVVMSAITWAELQRGLNIHQLAETFQQLAALIHIVPFDAAAGEVFGKLMQTGKHKASFDTLIASHAISLGLILVSNNEKDFSQFDLTVENWVSGSLKSLSD
ncbi:type II toxin-antitoxin system VapC family toxin [Wielerella bovis]|uniref:type II toxin-antitoxin system VapC family toxin n=1 Tax=Wielerella bovis TaxID=2917790 RepID=UPI002018FAEC|nr:type II toxin-antitoxin system VapC family toxin [Wielerella bovis]ULJ64269.1 type II toxin-antitoxin system VapC family toxin [Wielerella bovis]ULJ66488.1 type II toxin-antitoxin system VapC family toxin [Wielerella bovis]